MILTKDRKEDALQALASAFSHGCLQESDSFRFEDVAWWLPRR